MASYYPTNSGFAVSYRLKDRARQYVYGIKSEKVAKQIKAQKEIDEQLARGGIYPTGPSAAGRAGAAQTIEELIAQWRDTVLDGGAGRQHAEQQAAHAQRLVKLARIRNAQDIQVETVQRAMRKLRDAGSSPATCNHARQAIIQFERWLKRTDKIQNTRLQDLIRYNEEEDLRRQRRSFGQEEIDWLLTTTRNVRDRVARLCGISPADRVMLYATGLGTGFRRSALLKLTKPCFDVGPDVPQPAIRLAAAFNKNRRDRRQIIPRDLADQLHAWLRTRPDSGPVWRPAPHADLALRFRRDLETARAAWIAAAETAEGRKQRENTNFLKYVHHDGVRNVYADFHSLRHTGISFVVRAVGLRAGQAWADHSTPVLTARYAHVDDNDMAGAVNGLPDVSSATPPASDRAPPKS